MICADIFLTTLISTQVQSFSPQDKYKEVVGVEPGQLEVTRKHINEKVPGFAAVIHNGKLFVIKLTGKDK